MEALYPDDPFDAQETTADLFRLAKVGWFECFHENLRTAIRRFERQGNPAMADRARAYMDEELAALPELIKWCEESGFGYYGEA